MPDKFMFIDGPKKAFAIQGKIINGEQKVSINELYKNDESDPDWKYGRHNVTVMFKNIGPLVEALQGIAKCDPSTFEAFDSHASKKADKK